jgi:PAS domain S-box-containing protein
MQSSGQADANSSYRYEALFNNASIGIIIVDANGTIQSVNLFALNLFGFSEEELIGRPIELLMPVRHHLDHIRHKEKRALHLSRPPLGQRINLWAKKKDRIEFPVEVSLGYYTNEEDKHVIAFINDISERRMAQANIVKLNDELEAIVELRTLELTDAMRQLQESKEELSKLLEKEKDLSELKSRFLSMASHEFRTPLSTVLSSSYLIGKYNSAEDEPKRRKHLDRIVSSVIMLTDILNDFLSVGKIEEGKIPVRVSDFDMYELIRSIAEEMKNNLKKQQEILYCHTGVPMVNMDASILKHILMNLISNASKFSPEGGSIEIRTTHSKKRITCSVKDYGIGISEEDQKHLMERFFRGANAGNIQGTGLGLHIVSKYAELMNGNVKCKSVPGKGSEFIVTFRPQIP